MREHAFHDCTLRYLDQPVECGFGPLRVQVPAEARPRLADPDARYSDAVFFDFPDGTVRLSVLAAPRGGGLWPERAEDIAAQRSGLGEQVHTQLGEWGPELRITDADAVNWVIGRDGPRWMLLGRSTCHHGARTDLADTMRTMIRTSAVSRGDEPLPVGTPLPLTGLEERTDPDDAGQRANPYSGALALRIPNPRQGSGTRSPRAGEQTQARMLP
ncbi:MAG TPA: DUF3710 domain-containing protein [Pseudonocardia sp.]|jgi:hypothetical protein